MQTLNIWIESQARHVSMTFAQFERLSDRDQMMARLNAETTEAKRWYTAVSRKRDLHQTALVNDSINEWT